MVAGVLIEAIGRKCASDEELLERAWDRSEDNTLKVFYIRVIFCARER